MQRGENVGAKRGSHMGAWRGAKKGMGWVATSGVPGGALREVQRGSPQGAYGVCARGVIWGHGEVNRHWHQV